MKNYKHIFVPILVFILALGITPFSAFAAQVASPMPFTDVPANHWAYENIATMSQGNLMKGYGNGRFGPNDQFNIDQMCQMICNAQGYDTNADYPGVKLRDGDQTYWGYNAVNRCLNGGYLPEQGKEINAETYSVPCTRELAVYMIVKSLGYNAAVNDPYNSGKPYITEEDIPDFAWVDPQYMDAVADAYKLELVEGVDATHRFKPKGKMTRAEAATMLLNAGWTEGRPIAVMGEAPSNDELFERIQQLGGWKETKDPNTGLFVLKNENKDISGNIRVERVGDGKVLTITMDEDNRHTDSPDWYKGSAYSYAGRMRLKAILQAVYLDQADFEQAWGTVKEVLVDGVHEGSGTPSATRWVGHRCFHVGLAGNKLYVSLDAPNNATAYCSVPAAVDKIRPYTFLGKTAEEAYVGFEFDRW